MSEKDWTSVWGDCAGAGCVQVRRDGEKIQVRRAERPGVVVEFSEDEWRALQQFDIDGPS